MKNDPYLYDDVEVLVNKLNIKDKNKLEELEQDTIPFLMTALIKQGFKIESVHDIKKIHKFLFDPIFDWAGETRTITMYKREAVLEGASVDYTPAGYIEIELDELDKKFKSIKWSQLNTNEKLSKIIEVVQELWQIHCFREGNSRTTAIFLYFLLKTQGIYSNREFISKHSKYFRNALVFASIGSYSNSEFLQGIIEDSVTVKNIDTGKYETINGYNVEKYSYTEHTIEKIKTIKSYKDFQK